MTRESAYFDGNGQPVTLGNLLGRGGEGEVYAVASQPQMAAKILHPARRGGKHDKVRAMVARPPNGAYGDVEGLPVLTWPVAPLYADHRRRDGSTFVGYTMRRIAPRDFVPLYQLTASRRRNALGGTTLTWDRLVVLAMRLAHVVRTLHAFGYAVGDLNDRNVLVSRKLTPLLMDTDSFQVPDGRGGHHPSRVGDQLYWPPDLLDVDLTRHKESREGGDRYALAVLLFQLFMDGLRPYQSRGRLVQNLDSLVDKTRAGHYPWKDPRPGELEPPAGAPPYAALPSNLRVLFERAFVAGHHKPKRRPSADDWHAALQQAYAAGFRTCTRDARHVHAAELRGCPWCGPGGDPFGPPVPARRQPQPAATPKPATAGRKAQATRSLSVAKRSKSGGRKAPPQWQPPPAQPTPPAPAPRQAIQRPAQQGLPRGSPTASAGTTSNAHPSGRRVAFLLAVAALLVLPASSLILAPPSVAKHAVVAGCTTVLGTAVGSAATVPWLRSRTARWCAAWIAFGLALAGSLIAALLRGWTPLTWTAAAACVGAGLAALVLLQRRAGEHFHPTRRGVQHAAVAVGIAAAAPVLHWIWVLAT